MKDKLRELAERCNATANRLKIPTLPDSEYAEAHQRFATELLAILDAEGDGGAVPDGYTALLSDGKRYWSDKPGEYGEWRPYFLGDPVGAPPKVQP